MPFIKRTSHIRVVVDGEKREVKKPSVKKRVEKKETK
jgi:hypothetical protein